MIDHPENARTFSDDPTIQMPMSGDLRPTGTRIPPWAKDGSHGTRDPRFLSARRRVVARDCGSYLIAYIYIAFSRIVTKIWPHRSAFFATATCSVIGALLRPGSAPLKQPLEHTYRSSSGFQCPDAINIAWMGRVGERLQLEISKLSSPRCTPEDRRIGCTWDGKGSDSKDDV